MRPRTRVAVTVGAVVAVLAVLIAVFAVDSSRQSGRTARGLTVAGRPVGGMTESELRATVADVADDYEDAWVQVASPAGDLDTTAGAVGLELDEEAVVADALAVDRDAGALARPVVWARSLAGSRAVPLSFTVDGTELAAGTTTLADANRVEPTEPAVDDLDGTMAVVAGVDGRAVDLDALATQLIVAADTGVTPIRVEITPAPLPPRHGPAEAQALADRAQAATDTPLALEVGGKSATVVSATLRSWLGSRVGPNGLELTADQAKIVADLPTLVSDLGVAPQPATFTVDGDPAAGQVRIVDGQLGLTCCAPDTAQRIASALEAGEHTAAIDLWPVGPEQDTAWAQSLQIVEPVGTFTTNHPAGEDRVVNIHRIADIVRGMVIQPGELFSLNERVGQRTVDKGFVEAPVIYNDEHTTDVGGGVSQFATTTFNAAFFAGLDFEEYQSHTEIIGRYPTGREATVSWPSPDLKIRNQTPYGILIWTSYTDTSVTVTLYSTRWVSGEQTGQTTEPKGPCTRYTTERTRTYVDGHTDVDEVYGVYAPASGISCF